MASLKRAKPKVSKKKIDNKNIKKESTLKTFCLLKNIFKAICLDLIGVINDFEVAKI